MPTFRMVWLMSRDKADESGYLKFERILRTPTQIHLFFSIIIFHFRVVFFHAGKPYRSIGNRSSLSVSFSLLSCWSSCCPCSLLFCPQPLPRHIRLCTYTVESATYKVSVRQDAQLRPRYNLLCAWECPPPPPGGFLGPPPMQGTPTGTSSSLLQPGSLPLRLLAVPLTLEYFHVPRSLVDHFCSCPIRWKMLFPLAYSSFGRAPAAFLLQRQTMHRR